MKNLVLGPFLLFAIVRLTAEHYYYKIGTFLSKKKLPKHLFRQSCRQKKRIEKIFFWGFIFSFFAVISFEMVFALINKLKYKEHTKIDLKI